MVDIYNISENVGVICFAFNVVFCGMHAIFCKADGFALKKWQCFILLAKLFIIWAHLVKTKRSLIKSKKGNDTHWGFKTSKSNHNPRKCHLLFNLFFNLKPYTAHYLVCKISGKSFHSNGGGSPFFIYIVVKNKKQAIIRQTQVLLLSLYVHFLLLLSLCPVE